MLSSFSAEDGARLTYWDSGNGPLCLFQHGFGTGCHQVRDLWPETKACRLVCLNLRGHESSELGSPQSLGFTQAVSDLRALLTHLDATPAMIGGISLGGALALALADHGTLCNIPLVLARLAFDDTPDTENLRIFRALHSIIQEVPEHHWLPRLERTAEFQSLKDTAPANQETYRYLLSHPQLDAIAAWIHALAADPPFKNGLNWHAIQGDATVIGQAGDDLHPEALARTVAKRLPHAQLQWLPHRSVSESIYQEAFKTLLSNALGRIG